MLLVGAKVICSAPLPSRPWTGRVMEPDAGFTWLWLLQLLPDEQPRPTPGGQSRSRTFWGGHSDPGDWLQCETNKSRVYSVLSSYSSSYTNVFLKTFLLFLNHIILMIGVDGFSLICPWLCDADFTLSRLILSCSQQMAWLMFWIFPVSPVSDSAFCFFCAQTRCLISAQGLV